MSKEKAKNQAIKEAVEMVRKGCSNYSDFRIRDNNIWSEVICVMANKIGCLTEELEALKK